VVVNELELDIDDAANPNGIYVVIGQYYRRIEHLHRQLMSVDMRKEVASLRLKLVEIEQKGLETAFAKEHLSLSSYRHYQNYLRTLEQDINRDLVPTFKYLWLISRRVINKWYHEWISIGTSLRKRNQDATAQKNEYDPALSELFLANTAEIIQFLEKNQLRFSAEYIQQLKEFYLY
jgi:CPA1 family monovalent cation:H+ antiporter